MRIKACGLAALFVLLVGCSTTPISNEQARWASQSSILDRTYLNPAPGTGEVTVKRDSGSFGAACPTRIYLNGRALADLGAGEKVVAHLPAGDHILSAQPTGICGGGMSEAQARVVAGGRLNFRFGISSSGASGLYPTAF